MKSHIDMDDNIDTNTRTAGVTESMLTKPAGYDSLKDTQLQARIICNGVTYDDDSILDKGVRVTHAIYDQWSIGSAQAARLQVTLLADADDFTGGILPITFAVRYSDGSTSTDWIPQGTFYLDEVEDKYDGTVQVTAYDALLLAEEDFFPSGEVVGTWPQNAADVVSGIAGRLGVSYDISGFPAGIAQVPTPYSVSMREVLQDVAASAGGNFIVSKQGVLLFRGLESLQNRTAVEEVPASRLSIKSGLLTAGGVSLKDSTGAVHTYQADTTGYTIKGTCSYATDAIAETAYRASTYRGYSASGAILSPLLELGDCVSVDGKLMLMDSYDVRYDGWIHGTIESPTESEIQHRITYQHRDTVRAAQAAAQQVVTTPATVETLATSLVTDPTSLATLTNAIGGGSGGSSIEYLSGSVGSTYAHYQHFLRFPSQAVQIAWTSHLHPWTDWYTEQGWSSGSTDNGWHCVGVYQDSWLYPFAGQYAMVYHSECPIVRSVGNNVGRQVIPYYVPWEVGSSVDKLYQASGYVLELCYPAGVNYGNPTLPMYRLWRYLGPGASDVNNCRLPKPLYIIAMGKYVPSNS